MCVPAKLRCVPAKRVPLSVPAARESARDILQPGGPYLDSSNPEHTSVSGASCLVSQYVSRISPGVTSPLQACNLLLLVVVVQGNTSLAPSLVPVPADAPARAIYSSASTEHLHIGSMRRSMGTSSDGYQQHASRCALALFWTGRLA